MSPQDWQQIEKEARDNEKQEASDQAVARRLTRYILLGCVVIILIALVSGFVFVRSSLRPVDKHNETMVEVTIPIGSSNHEIVEILEEEDLIRNASLMDIYLKIKNISNLQAGYYEFSPSMTADDVIDTLQAGGRPIGVDVDQTITVVEGMQLEEIAQVVEKHTNYTAKEFMTLVNQPKFIESLMKDFPSLLEGLTDREGLKYPLEGYLYPATYDYFADLSLEDLIKQMIGQTNLEYQKLKPTLDEHWLDFHEVLTLASLVEKEGQTQEDRRLIAGVFFNRLNAEMPIQSDISILYALGEHKELVTYADLEVDSPYNLYTHNGIGPGPFNNPSAQAIEAVLEPEYSDYYYFVADIDTQKVYYAEDYETHESLVEKYVNSRIDLEEVLDEEANDEEISDETDETDE